MRMLRAATVLVVLGAASGAAADDAEARARRLQAEGVRFLEAGELLRARTAFSAAQALVPGRANPLRWLGLVDARLGRCADAARSLDEFLRRVPAGDPRVPEVREARERCVPVRPEDAAPITRALDLRPGETVRVEIAVTPGAPPATPGPTTAPAAPAVPREPPPSGAATTGAAIATAPDTSSTMTRGVSGGPDVSTLTTPRPSSEAPPPSTVRPSVRPFYRTWWFWTVVGVAAAGTAVAAGVAATVDRGAPAPFAPIHVF